MKVTKRTVLWIVPLLLIAALYYFFKPDPDSQANTAYVKKIELVENSGVTFEQAFSNYCSKANWEYFTTSRRQKVVEFKGECPVAGKTQPVNLQILLDKESPKHTIGALLFNYEQQQPTKRDAFIKEVYAAYN